MSEHIDSEREVLRTEDLVIGFPSPVAPVLAANYVTLRVKRGETLGLVGESGSGKSVTLRSLVDLVPSPGRVLSGRFYFDGERRSPEELAALRGDEVSMIFQDPASGLNPVLTVGAQLREVLRVKRSATRQQAAALAVDLLDQVGIAHPRERIGAYPHELSGGMRQRVMIALAIASRPRLLLADEPTTALDVTTQAQILELLRELQEEFGMAMILVTHDLGVVAQICHEVSVMYAGHIVERRKLSSLLDRPCHPYTKGLFAATPQLEGDELPVAIPGQPPDLAALPPGCPFQPRCPEARAACADIDMRAEAATSCACPFERRDVAVAGGGAAL